MKQVIILRKDLNMRKGKMIAQGAHASIEAMFNAMEINTAWYNAWYSHDDQARMKKIVVYVEGFEKLEAVYQAACSAHLPASLIQDAGLTEFKEPTWTAAAIGPAPDDAVDLITRELPLL